MNDSMNSVKTCDEAINLHKELSELWGKSGMYAPKWVLNESEVLKESPEKDRTMEVNLKCGEFPSIKTFGILLRIHLHLKMPLIPAVKRRNIPNEAS